MGVTFVRVRVAGHHTKRVTPPPESEKQHLARRLKRILRGMEVQLRDYRIKPGHMPDWLAGWRSGIVPLREQAGFEIVGALSLSPAPSGFIQAATMDMVEGATPWT